MCSPDVGGLDRGDPGAHPHYGVPGVRRAPRELRGAWYHRGAAGACGQARVHRVRRVERRDRRARKRECTRVHEGRRARCPRLPAGLARSGRGGHWDRLDPRRSRRQELKTRATPTLLVALLSSAEVLTVLVADDSNHMRELVRITLSSQGWRVVETGDPGTVSELVKTAKHDVVLLDVTFEGFKPNGR